MVTLDIYRLDVENAELKKIDEIITNKNFQCTRALNGNGGLITELSIFDKKASKANLQRFRNQIAVRRDNEIIWWGPLVKVSGEMDDVSGNITLEGSEYLHHFKKRKTDKLIKYVEEDQEDIAWDLIDTVQSRTNGTLLVNRGSHGTSVSISKDYEYAIVEESIIDLANVVDGFDFTFDPVLGSDGLIESTNFNCYYPMKGSVRKDLPPLQIGVNVKKIGFVTNTELINSGIAEGQGTGTTPISELEYGESQKGYTRREEYQSYKDVSLSSVLSLYLRSYLNNQSVEGFDINAELMPNRIPTFNQITLGDIIKVDFQVEGSGGYFDIKKQARVIEMAITIDENGVERAIPKLQILG
jgi:hypothetical protein